MDPTLVAFGAVAVSFLSFGYTFVRNRSGAITANASRFIRIELLLEGLQKEMNRLTTILEKFQDMQSDVRILDTRVLHLEEDFRLLRKGEGWITGSRSGIDGLHEGKE